MKLNFFLKHVLVYTFFVFMMTACSHQDTMTDNPLNFSGDLLLWSSIQDVALELEVIKVKYHEDTIDAYDLLACIHEFGLTVVDYNVYIRASDGFLVKLDGSTISNTYLAHIDGQGWTYISDKHPVNSGVKNISDIILVSNSNSKSSENKLISGLDPDNYGLNIIHGEEDIYYTKGELLMLNDKQLILEDGISSYEGISISVLKQTQVVSLELLIDKEFDKLLVYTFNGEEFYDYNRHGSIEVTSDQINYISDDMEDVKLNIVGIMLDPIGSSVMNNYYDVQYYLEKDQRVISILLDGFSYEQYKTIQDKYPDLLLSGLENVLMAKTVYKPVTNAGFAAIVSGVEPNISGILDRSYRELNVASIFDYCENNNKSHVLIEGDINILNLHTSTLLNLDTDNNGFTDNEIMETTRKILEDEYDYTFIHFHSIDEYGHKFGPLSNETLDQIRLIDTYLDEIIGGFNGKVIMTADHGMHSVEDYGDHGDFRHEDLFVPYVIVDGGKYE